MMKWRQLTVEDIAKRFNISTSHLSRIFREHTGVTLVEYLNIRKSRGMPVFFRHTNKAISDISDAFTFVIKVISPVYSKNIQE